MSRDAKFSTRPNQARPCIQNRIANSRPTAVGLTPREFRSLLVELTDQPTRTMVITSACLGLRGGELTALQWGDFSADGSILSVQRDTCGRLITCAQLPVCPQLANIFNEFKSRCRFTLDTDWVFATRYDPRVHLHPVQILARIKAAAKSAFLPPLGWHTLRCTLASTLISLGFDLSTVCRFMRHKNVETTLWLFKRRLLANSQPVPKLGTLLSAGAAGNLRDAAAEVAQILLSTCGTEVHKC